MLTETKQMIRDLGAGLVLRHGTPADADALSAFNAMIHADDGLSPDVGVGTWTRDLLTRPHPTMTAADFTIVEEAATGRIISTLNLISQTWTYAGIPFGVGRPEAVGTLPEFRRRGLVRVQMDVVHRWSAERGHLAQAITGIPNYYRQFDYEMTLPLGGARSGFAAQVPALKEGEAEPYRVRPAAEADLSFIAELHAHSTARTLIACPRDLDLMRYELTGHSPEGIEHRVHLIIESAAGEVVGWLAHRPVLWPGGPAGLGLLATNYEIAPGQSWLAVTPSVIRYLWTEAQRIAAAESKTAQRFGFALGAGHPVNALYPSHLPMDRRAYGWYIRVPDVPAFIRHVVPALEQNLAASPAVGYSGELKINFYRRGGLRLALERGRLAGAEPWKGEKWDDGNAAFPDLTFLHLLLGHRSFDELNAAYPDCYAAGDEQRAVLNGLFPKRPSWVWPIG